jgi:putative addiction module component (TIGR02574 family)
MTEESAALLKSALTLPESERIWLTEQLLQSLPPQQAGELEDAFLEELEGRAAEANADPTSLLPWSEIKRMT